MMVQEPQTCIRFYDILFKIKIFKRVYLLSKVDSLYFYKIMHQMAYQSISVIILTVSWANSSVPTLSSGNHS
jgi:hypothetical protein